MKLKKIAFFFTTRGRSLSHWDTLGILQREIKPYIAFAEYFETVHIFTYGIDDSSYQNLFPHNVSIVPKPKGMPTVLYSFLLPLIHRKKLQGTTVLRTNQMDGSWAAVIAKKLYGGLLVVRCGYEWLYTVRAAKKSLLKRCIAYWAEQFAYRNADCIIQTSSAAVSFAEKEFPGTAAKTAVIPNFIDVYQFVPNPQLREPRRILFVGRLEVEKNLQSLIAAVSGLPVRLVVIGAGSMRKELEASAAALCVAVEFKGVIPQQQLVEEYQKSDIFCLPSNYEGNPKALLEAMSCGLACVASDVPGNREVVQNEKNGILCTTDAGSIAAAIQRLLDDSTIRENVRIAARDTVIAAYSFDHIFHKELSICTQMYTR